MRGYSIFKDQISQALEKFPKCFEADLNGRSIIKGEVDIIDIYGKHWESYSIEIHCSEEFPQKFPDLLETSNKFPKIADWHVYEDTLTCCVKILPDELLRCSNGITILEFMEEEVLPYLFNQTHRKVEGYYINGEYSHGLKGIFEFYSRIMKTDNILNIIKYMYYIASHKKPDRTSLCFCGSGTKFRKCHRNAFDKLAPLGKEILELHAYNLDIAFKTSIR